MIVRYFIIIIIITKEFSPTTTTLAYIQFAISIIQFSLNFLHLLESKFNKCTAQGRDIRDIRDINFYSEQVAGVQCICNIYVR